MKMVSVELLLPFACTTLFSNIVNKKKFGFWILDFWFLLL